MSGRHGATTGHLFGPQHRTEPGNPYRADPPKSPPKKTGSNGGGGEKPPKKTGLCMLMLFGLFIAGQPERPKPHGAPKKGSGKYPGDPRGNRASSERRWDHQTGYRHARAVGGSGGGGNGGKPPRKTSLCMFMVLFSMLGSNMSKDRRAKGQSARDLHRINQGKKRHKSQARHKAPKTGFCMLMAFLSVASMALAPAGPALPRGAVWGSLGAAARMGLATPKRFVLRAILHYQTNYSAGLNLCPRTDGPHCSKYGYGAVSRYGAVIGMVLALRYMGSCAAPSTGNWGDGECCKGESPTPTLPKGGCFGKSSVGLWRIPFSLLLTAAVREDYGPTGTCCRG
jgi:putative component of membrane protein insertase Oxa1/YidC/SpoIIIJ protein YidD